MADTGHERTNDIIEEMTKQIEKEYEKAAKAVEKKLNAYLKSFDQKEAEQLKLLEDGKISEQQFATWRQTQLLTGQRWQDLLEQLTGDMVNANDIARSTIRGHMADVYTLNRNYAAYQVEEDAHIDTSWTLYNRRATENLFKNNDNLLPMPKPGGRAWQQMQNEDTRWNQQKINSSMIQGILQGDGIRELSGRLMHVVGMNENSAVRSARTMTTYVQNKARDDTFEELAEKGIEMEQQWVATLDDRTRSTHRWLHGEVRSEEGTYSNGLRFPGDPLGDPEEVYNCRCTEISHVKGFPLDIPRTSPKMTMDFDEWLGEKPERLADVEPIREQFVPAKTIEEAEAYASRFAEKVNYSGLSLKNANAINEQLTELTYKYPIKPLRTLGVSSTRGAMSANCISININPKKLGKALTDEVKIFQQNHEQIRANIEYVKARYPGKIPAGVQRKIDKMADSLNFTRWGVHSSYDDHVKAVLTHEYGHLLSDQYFGMINREHANPAYRTNPELRDISSKWGDAYLRAIKSGDIYKLSEYGRSNVDEFFAESFLAREMGETLPSYVEDLMKEVLKNGIMQ